MNKKLPSVFANKSIKSSGNNEKVFYSSNSEVVDNSDRGIVTFEKNINQKINDIFNSSNYIYKADVEIILGDKTVTKRIVGKNSTHLITMDNELIPITDIVDIKKKSWSTAFLKTLK